MPNTTLQKTLQALETLKQARDLVAGRMTERIVAEHLDLLQDARGESFMDEIEALHSQLGKRLNQLNQMIADLEAVVRTAKRDRDTPRLPFGRGRRSVPAVTAPAPVVQSLMAPLTNGDVALIGKTLVSSLGLDDARATECAQYFFDHVRQSPEALQELRQIRGRVLAGHDYELFHMLKSCFGLDDRETVVALDKLRQRFNQ